MISKYKTFLPAAVVGLTILGMAAPAVAQEAADSAKVQVAFRKVNKNEVLGGVEVLNMTELMKKNYINDINNSTMSGYVAGFNGNSLWGMDSDDSNGMLVLIDGVPRDLNNIPSIEVEEITFLKGAQAVVLYGSRAAKGVVYITTKRGGDSPIQITAQANTGWAVAKSLPEYLGSAEYMTYYNRARQNDGLSPLYSEADIYHHAVGKNPYRYPNVNMYSADYMKKVYNRSDADLQIKGGNNRARFYTNINYFRSGDYLTYGEAKNNFNDRFSVRGNVDVNLTDWASAYVNSAATFYNARGAHGSYWSAASTLRPNRINPLIPFDMVNPAATAALDLLNSSNLVYNNSFLAGTSIDKTNIFADYLAKGYNTFVSRQFQFDAGLRFDLGSITPGLTFNTQFAVDYATSYNQSYTDNYAVFVPEWANYNGKDEIVGVTMEGKNEHTGNQNVSDSQSNQTMYFNAQFDYARTFGDVHNVHAIASANGWQRTFSGQYHRTSSANLGLLASYNYDSRYYADLAVSAIHSAKLAPGKRQAWSPSLTLGWRVSQEDFLKDNDMVNELMVSASASKLHTDLYLNNYYMYAANYTTGGWYSWASSGQAAAYPKRGPNDALTFITRTEYSANVRGEFFNRMLGLNASVFRYDIDGLVINNSTKFPSYFSTYYPEASFVPYLNANANRRTGFDFGVEFNKTIGEVHLTAGVNGTYYNATATKRDEVYADAYQYREGKPVNSTWGYECLGFFTSKEDVLASPDQTALGGSNIQGGDLKYKDQNGDGIINEQDQVYLGKNAWYGDPFVMGVNLTAQYKGFTLFVHGVGRFGANNMLNNSYYWVYGDGKYSAVVRDSWTEATAATATYPRLTTTNGANNFVASDFWMYSADYFNIAKIQLTYDFPKSLFAGSSVNALQVYVSGSDIAGFGKNRKFIELNVGSAPQSAFYNLGAKVTF